MTYVGNPSHTLLQYQHLDDGKVGAIQRCCVGVFGS